MTFYKSVLFGAALLLGGTVYGSTYYAGAEDFPGLDYDYNDVIFSVSGDAVTLHSAGTWSAAPALGTSQAPFWNRSSLDGSDFNVGYCIYGGGSCAGALAPGAKYLASDPKASSGSANDVYFSVAGAVTLNIKYQFTADQDVIGWYLLSSPATVHSLNPASNSGSFNFTPGGLFGLTVANAQGDLYYSQRQFGTQDSVSHFAFFGTEVADAPEPGMLSLFLLATLALGFGIRKGRANLALLPRRAL